MSTAKFSSALAKFKAQQEKPKKKCPNDFTQLSNLPPPVFTRVAWLHVPKTSSGFANVLFRAACRLQTPKPFLEVVQVQCLIADHCPKTFVQFDWGHKSLRSLRPGMMAVTLLREPWQRAVSGFFHNLHSCRWMQARYNMTGNRPRAGTSPFYKSFTGDDVKTYADCVSACSVRMTTGRLCSVPMRNRGVDQAALASSWRLVKAANETLRRFAFVGITDEYERTLKAFAAMSKTPLIESDFKVMRKGVKPERDLERVEAIVRSRRHVDDELYATAKQILALEEVGQWPPAAAGKYQATGTGGAGGAGAGAGGFLSDIASIGVRGPSLAIAAATGTGAAAAAAGMGGWMMREYERAGGGNMAF